MNLKKHTCTHFCKYIIIDIVAVRREVAGAVEGEGGKADVGDIEAEVFGS